MRAIISALAHGQLPGPEALAEAGLPEMVESVNWNKEDLIRRIAREEERRGRPIGQRDIERVINSFIAHTHKAIASGGQVQLRRLGTFSSAERQGRSYYLPDGDVRHRPPSKGLRFRPAKALKQAVPGSQATHSLRSHDRQARQLAQAVRALTQQRGRPMFPLEDPRLALPEAYPSPLREQTLESGLESEVYIKLNNVRDFLAHGAPWIRDVSADLIEQILEAGFDPETADRFDQSFAHALWRAGFGDPKYDVVPSQQILEAINRTLRRFGLEELEFRRATKT